MIMKKKGLRKTRKLRKMFLLVVLGLTCTGWFVRYLTCRDYGVADVQTDRFEYPFLIAEDEVK